MRGIPGVLLAMFEPSLHICTGTLVAPNLVLTARHCTTQVDDSNVACPPRDNKGVFGADLDMTKVFVYAGVNAPTGVINRTAAAAKGKSLVVDPKQTSMCGGDIALIVLDRPITDKPVAKIRFGTNAKAGETVHIVGFGTTETGNFSDQRMTRAVPVKTVGPVASSEGKTLSAGEFVLGEGDCRGDSGGPALDASGSVVGVLSRGGGGQVETGNGAQGCVGSTHESVRTSLLEKKPLIETAFEQSGNRLESQKEDEEVDEQSTGGFSERESSGEDEDEEDDDTSKTTKSARRSVAVPPPMGCSVTHRPTVNSSLVFLGAVSLLAIRRQNRKRRC